MDDPYASRANFEQALYVIFVALILTTNSFYPNSFILRPPIQAS